MKIKKSNFGNNSGFIGNGKLTDYKKDGSWIMKQIEKGWKNVDRSITVNKKDDYVRFTRIASKIVKFDIDKKYKKLESTSNTNYRFALKWSLSGDLNGSTMKDLNLMQEFLFNEVERDYQKMISVLKAEFEFIGQAVVDFNTKAIKVEAIISFKSDINITQDKINIFLGKLNFNQVKK